MTLPSRHGTTATARVCGLLDAMTKLEERLAALPQDQLARNTKWFSLVSNAIDNLRRAERKGLYKLQELPRSFAEAVNKQTVIDRLRPVFEKAVDERTGVSFFLTEAEQLVFGESDLRRLKDETGYTAMLSGRS
jgi:hypothetical protein